MKFISIGSRKICISVFTCQTHKCVSLPCSLLLFHLFGRAELLRSPQISSACSEETSWLKRTAFHSPPRTLCHLCSRQPLHSVPAEGAHFKGMETLKAVGPRIEPGFLSAEMRLFYYFFSFFLCIKH